MARYDRSADRKSETETVCLCGGKQIQDLFAEVLAYPSADVLLCKLVFRCIAFEYDIPKHPFV